MIKITSTDRFAASLKSFRPAYSAEWMPIEVAMTFADRMEESGKRREALRYEDYCSRSSIGCGRSYKMALFLAEKPKETVLKSLLWSIGSKNCSQRIADEELRDYADFLRKLADGNPQGSERAKIGMVRKDGSRIGTDGGYKVKTEGHLKK